ncbi:hypothetical protein AMJ49_03960 [Parcubacteria bacterium DG_74_2]|nr:MAG: hypothetical protein AMJ49_03960 [Parcubacteria bacterium DG_74_2]
MEKWIRMDERLKPLGKNRDKRFQEFNEIYGKGNWRLVWYIGPLVVDYVCACALYEDAYYKFFNNNPAILNELVKIASNVYDDNISNINSGFDYTKQETIRTHIQDIAIRRVFLRMGIWFEGDDLIQIRSTGAHFLSAFLSPGRVPFHRPDLILKPELKGWWNMESVESFYQSNRFLQLKAQK